MTNIHESRYFFIKKKYCLIGRIMTNMHNKMCVAVVCFFFFFLFPPSPLPLPYPPSMEEPTSAGTPPRVTRRGTSLGDNPPPQDFDRGWSSLRLKKSTAGVGVCFSLPPPAPPRPLPHLSLPAPLPLTLLRACFVLPCHNFRVSH